MEYFIYFLGFMLINASANVGIPREHQVNLWTWNGLIQQLLIVAGVLCIINSHMIK